MQYALEKIVLCIVILFCAPSSFFPDQKLSSTPEAPGCTRHPGTLNTQIIYTLIHFPLAVAFPHSLHFYFYLPLSLGRVLQAPGDAEALCAQLVREGTVHAVASEDMDTLPFGGSILIRQLNAKRSRWELCNLSVS